MVAISRKLEQKSVRRRYYHGEKVPTAREFRLMIRRDVRSVDGFEIKDVAVCVTEDEFGVPHTQVVALCERDGTTLEAQQDARNEKLIEEMKRDPLDTISYLHDELKMEPTGGDF